MSQSAARSRHTVQVYSALCELCGLSEKPWANAIIPESVSPVKGALKRQAPEVASKPQKHIQTWSGMEDKKSRQSQPVARMDGGSLKQGL